MEQRCIGAARSERALMSRVGEVYVAICDSDDLGIDRGTRARVWREYADGRSGGMVDLYVDTLDMTIARVRMPHPDLRKADS